MAFVSLTGSPRRMRSRQAAVRMSRNLGAVQEKWERRGKFRRTGAVLRCVASRWPLVPVAAEMESFDRYQFVSKTIEGEVDPVTLNNAILVAMGFTWDPDSQKWRDEHVREEFAEMCKRLSDPHPPNFMHDAVASDMLERTLPQTPEVQEGLKDHIEVLYGEEITKYARETGDQDFLRREVVVKWLHIYAGF